MANKSSFSISQNPTKEYDEQPYSLRESTCIPKNNSDDLFESDHQQEERSDISSCQKIHHNSEHNIDLLSANNYAVRPDSEEYLYKPRRLRMPLPPTPLDSSLNNLVTSDSTGLISNTSKDIHDYEQMDQPSSLSDEYENNNFSPAYIKNLHEESLVLTCTKSKRATQKCTQGNVQEDTLSKISEGYVIEHIAKPPVTDKMKSPYLKVIATNNKTINSEYYDWCEVKDIQKMLATPHIAATCASVEHSRVHHTNQLLYDKELMSRQSMHIDATVALTVGNTCNDTRKLTSGIIKSELQCIDSTTKTYDHTYKVDSPTLKKDSDIYPYDYVHYSYVEMYKHRR